MKKHSVVSVLEEMTHDIKSPLAKIKAIAMILSSKVENAKGEEELIEYIARMEDAVSRLDNSLNVLFDFVFLSEDNRLLLYEFFDVDEVINSTIKYWEKEGAKISYKKDNAKHEIMADKKLIKTAIEIFIKAAQKDGSKKPIKISIKSTPKELLIYIEDRKTLPKEDKGILKIERLLAERIMELHKGRIFQKKEEKISTMCIAFPRSK